MKTFKIFLVSLLALNLVLFVLCQDTQGPPEAPKAPTNLIIDKIGTITTQPATVSIPDSLSVPKGHTFSFLLYASGNQKFQCVATPGQSSFWMNVGVVADLINDKSNQRFDPSFEVVHHYTEDQPKTGGNFTWKSLIKNDTSYVTAKSVASVPQDGKRLPWELYIVTQRSEEGGRFSTISYVLMLNTNGGISPPGTECGVNYRNGQELDIQYDAEYWYFEGSLPSNEPAPPTNQTESNDGYSAKTLHNQTPLSLISIGPGQLGWVAIIGFVSVSVIFF